MSFAATLALIAAYERGLPWMAQAPTRRCRRARRAVGRPRDRGADPCLAGRRPRDHALRRLPFPPPRALRRASPICFAMPIVSIWVMPIGLLALIAMPFGFDGLLWRLMGDGIDWMIAVALFVANLPGAVGRMAAFGIGPLLLGTGGLVLLVPAEDAAALERRARWSSRRASGRSRAPLPDVLVVVRRPGGGGARRRRTAFDPSRPAATPSRRANGSPPTAMRGCRTTRRLGQGFRCDPSGCIARLRRRQARLAGARGRRLRGGLPTRRRRGDRPRSAAGLPGADRRPHRQPRPGRDRAQAERRGLGCNGGAAGGPGPAVGARRCRACGDTGTSPVAAAAARRDAANRGSGSGRVIRAPEGRHSFGLRCPESADRLSPLCADIANWPVGLPPFRLC